MPVAASFRSAQLQLSRIEVKTTDTRHRCSRHIEKYGPGERGGSAVRRHRQVGCIRHPALAGDVECGEKLFYPLEKIGMSNINGAGVMHLGRVTRRWRAAPQWQP